MNTFTPTSWKAWAQSFPAKAEKDAPYKSPFTIVNKGSATEDAEILLYDVIGRDWWSGEGWAANDFAEKLKEIDPKAKLVIGINSPGGNVDDGLAIFNMLQRRGNVTTRNDGMAASIASVILQAGDTRQSAESAMVMIHKAWSLFAGNADDSRKFAAILDKHDQVIAETYAKRSGESVESFLALMKDESWFTGKEAKDAGLVDEIHQPTSNKNLAAQSSAPSKPLAKTQPDDSAASISDRHPSQILINNDSLPFSTSISASAVAVADGQQTAAITHKTKENKSMSEPTTAPAVANPPADNTAIIDAIKAGFADIKNTFTANTLPGAAPLPGTHRVENLGNPLVESFNAAKHDHAKRAKLVKAHYADLRNELIKAMPGGMGDIKNQNTVDSTLANTILSGDFITTMRSKTAMLGSFGHKVEIAPLAPRDTIKVELVSSAGTVQTNPTNFETGDTTSDPVTISVDHISKSFHVSMAERNVGLALASKAPTNAKIVSEKLVAICTALMTNANFGADVVIGAAASFNEDDLPAILRYGKNYSSIGLLLEGDHYYGLAPRTRDNFSPTEGGQYMFDGGIWKNNLWTGGATDICGLVYGPDAIVWGSAPTAVLPQGEFITQADIALDCGAVVQAFTWFSRASRSLWGSFDIAFGAAVGDGTQAEVLTTQ